MRSLAEATLHLAIAEAVADHAQLRDGCLCGRPNRGMHCDHVAEEVMRALRRGGWLGLVPSERK